MRFAVDPWDPSYGASLDREPVESSAEVDLAVERPPAAWAPVPVPGAVPAPPAVLFVDGVRRVDAQVWVGEADGAAAPALCASYAAGVVRTSGGDDARLVAARVRRGLFTTADTGVDIVTPAGTYIAGRTAARPGTPPLQVLSLAVQRGLAEAEAAVAAEAAAGPRDLLVVDGPLHGREHVPRAVGFVKSHRSDYLPAEQAAIVGSLRAGERTPLFLLGSTWRRYTWYLRLPCPPGAPWAGVVRVECDAEQPAAEAMGLAALSQVTLPRFASVAYKDARAPQNLYPIAGLERELRRRLGDPAVLYRALRRAAGQPV